MFQNRKVLSESECLLKSTVVSRYFKSMNIKTWANRKAPFKMWPPVTPLSNMDQS